MSLIRNSTYSFLAAALPTVVSIATVPLFVTAIGPGRYGILAIAWIVLGYFGAADFGIGRAITQRISTMRSEGRAAMARAVWSALISMLGFGLVGALMVFITARWYFGGPFEADDSLRAEIIGALWVLALCNPVVAVGGVLSGALVGLERFRLVSLCSLLGNAALLLFPLATALLVSTELTALILASLAARLLSVAILAGGVWSAFLRGHKVRFSREEFGRLANFGAWIMVTALIGPFMVFADRFVIGAVQDAAAVAAYAIPFQIASRTQIFPLAVTQALFPRFAAEGEEASSARCRDFTAFIGQLFAPVIIGLICLAAPLLELWLGDALDRRSVLVAQWVLAGFWINAVAQVPYGYIQARGNPRFTALLHTAELPFYLLLLFVLGQQYGLAGFAAAFACRCAVDCALLCRRAGAVDGPALARLVLTAVLVLAALAAGSVAANWWVLLGWAGALAGAAGIALLVGMPNSIRERLLELRLFRGRAKILLQLGRPAMDDRPNR